MMANVDAVTITIMKNMNIIMNIITMANVDAAMTTIMKNMNTIMNIITTANVDADAVTTTIMKNTNIIMTTNMNIIMMKMVSAAVDITMTMIITIIMQMKYSLPGAKRLRANIAGMSWNIF